MKKKFQKRIFRNLVVLGYAIFLAACGLGEPGNSNLHPSQKAPTTVTSVIVQKDNNDQNVLAWHGQSAASSYKLLLSPTDDFSSPDSKTHPLKDASFSISELTQGETYYAIVISLWNRRESPKSKIFDFEVPPTTPDSIDVSIDNNRSLINLQWQAVADVDSYNVYWSLSDDITTEKFGGVVNNINEIKLSQSFAELLGVAKEKTVYFIVTAVINNVESLVSSNSKKNSIHIHIADEDITSRPKVSSIFPINNEINVNVTLERINVTFTKAIADDSINIDTFEVFRPNNSKVSGTVSHGQNGETASFTPDNLLVSNTKYTVKLGTNIENVDGLALAKEFVSSFTTVLPQLSFADVSVSEATGTANIAVTLSEASGSTTTLTYRTVNSSATAPSDFTAISTGNLNIAAGDIRATISVDIKDDSIFEPDEQFTIEIETLNGATISNAQGQQGIITLKNDDRPDDAPDFSITSGDRKITLEWTAISGVTSYNVYYSRQSGIAPDNYSSLNGILLSVQNSDLVINQFNQSSNPNGLKLNVSYYFVLTALTNSLESPTSIEKTSKLKVVPTKPINDTGIIFSGEYPEGNNTTCTGDNVVDQQDCSHGRDVSFGDNDNDGHAGFSYTKLDSNGNNLSFTADIWTCVRDNVTGLIWEVKTLDGLLRDQNHTYTWYSTGTNDSGAIGTANGGTCFDASNCDTEKYVEQANSTGLCGATDWRMPTRSELRSLVNLNVFNPAIDKKYFQNTINSYYWSSSPSANDTNDTNRAWQVDFSNGAVRGNGQSNGHGNEVHVRLVRSDF